MRLINFKRFTENWALIRPSIKLLLFCFIASSTHAQDDQNPTLNIGDPAPPLRVHDWIKGTPVKNFEKGQVYIVEFWATWCLPCIASMPHLSVLAREYKDKITILSINVKEKKTTSLKKVKAFVDSMGHRMEYNVAAQDSNFMEVDWFQASREQGIPISFVVNAEGRLAWIGHPKDLDKVLSHIVNNTWDINAEFANRNESKRLEKMNDSLRFELNMYVGNASTGDLGNPDSALLLLNEIIIKEPKLKYAPSIVFHTFSSLLKTNPHKAYEYGKVVLVTPTYNDPSYQGIIDNIKWYSDKLDIPTEIYELGAEAYQAKIDKYGKLGYMNIPNNYKNMADMYWRAKNKLKAIGAMQKAIEGLKSQKDFSAPDLKAFEFQLQQYKNM